MIEVLKSRSLHILLAEDDEFNRLYFEKVISRIECTIDTVEDGKSALAKCTSNNYDLVFLDLHMPYINGIDVLKLTQEESSINTNTPFISVSGTAVEDEVVKIKNAGFVDILHKPFSPDDLIKTIYHSLIDTTENSTLKIVSLSQLQKLYGDDKEIISELLKAIKQALPAYIDKINEPDFYQDISSMKFLIHKIKPSFGYLGIHFTAFNLDEMEDLLIKGIIPDNIEDVCNTLVNTAKTAIIDIEQLLDN